MEIDHSEISPLLKLKPYSQSSLFKSCNYVFLIQLSGFFSFLIIILFAIFYSLLDFNNIGESEIERGAICAWLSAAAYCPRDSYSSRTFEGPTKDFQFNHVIYDSSTDTQGFIGNIPALKTIYVVFRGSSSSSNFLTDVDISMISYNSYPECNCLVHKGFYTAQQSVIQNIILTVANIKIDYPEYQVIVTGHSLGGALAHFTGMDLYRSNILSTVITFGMPRIGSYGYSAFAGKILTNSIRYTHYKDRSPHLPSESYGFYQVCTEYYEDLQGNVTVCNDSCEDPACADQFKFQDTGWGDHHVYLNVPMSCKYIS